MNGWTTEMNLTLEELEDILQTVKTLKGHRCTLYMDNSSGIGSILQCGVHVDVDGVEGELITIISDVDKW